MGGGPFVGNETLQSGNDRRIFHTQCLSQKWSDPTRPLRDPRCNPTCAQTGQNGDVCRTAQNPTLNIKVGLLLILQVLMGHLWVQRTVQVAKEPSALTSG